MSSAASGTLVFGATGGTGFEVTSLLRSRGERVVAMVRQGSDAAKLEELGVEVVRGDVLKREDVDNAYKHLGDGGVVISALGARKPEDRPVDTVGQANVADAALGAAVRSFVLITSLGCGEMRPYMSERALQAFGDALIHKTKSEEYLKGLDLPWRIIRPGGLRSEPATGGGALYDHVDIHGMIHRADLAQVIVAAAESELTLRKALVALDSGQVRGEAPVGPLLEVNPG